MSGVGKEQSRTPDWQSGLGHETEIEKRSNPWSGGDLYNISRAHIIRLVVS